MLFKLDLVLYKSINNRSCADILKKQSTYSKRVLLPQTKLPLHLNKNALVERDSRINNDKEFQELYQWQRDHLVEKEFVLHDGPPYANGPPHMGHAINKILKDVIVRCKILEGRKVNYIPGWDCHGLPIELKALLKFKGEQLSPIQIRQKARSFATETIERQKSAFRSWGVIGDWENAYMTFSKNYIKNQIQQFYHLYEKNLIYRDFKPVYWSPSSRTALAESELEYNTEHISKSVTLRIKLCQVPDEIYNGNLNVYALVWTTTPWTLPCNQAICFNAELNYSCVQKPNDDNIYIIASDLADNVSKTLNCDLKVLKNISGAVLKHVVYQHPLDQRKKLPFVHSVHATSSKGTGLVHCAPAHGPEDFLVALANKMSIETMVNGIGQYTDKAGDKLQGKFVLTDGLDAVLDLISSDIMNLSDYKHSYPYDWRTNKPVIIRASLQWFMDTNALKDKAMELLNIIKIFPEINSDIYRKNMLNQLQKRPYWCISRQRVWGVPIPVFYDKYTFKPIINDVLIKHLCHLIDEHGTDFWWNLEINDLIPEKMKTNLSTDLNNLVKGEDILDIWFDSGISWSSVLTGDQVADVYLEGLDQFTGWFQSSLMTSVALRNKSPFKTIYVHGFAVDENGLKMSKSVGNVINPADVMQGAKGRKGYGVDTLRWWVACHANLDSLAQISDNVLQASAIEVQKIRSILRFSLGALFDYEHENFKYDSLSLLDKYLLHLLWNFKKDACNNLETYYFNKIGSLVINFLTTPVSALYYTSIKDRLYCESKDSIRRLSAQYVLLQIFLIITENIAPIVPHLAEELYSHLPQKTTTSIFKKKPCLAGSNWCNSDINDLMQIVLDIKKDLNKEVGASTQHLSVDLKLPINAVKLIEKIECQDELHSEFADIFQVSRVNIEYSTDKSHHEIAFQNSNLHLCLRCRRVASECKQKLCNRCDNVVNSTNASHKTSLVN